MASINQMIHSGIKIWIVLDADVNNINHFLNCAGKALGCRAWYYKKQHAFIPETLSNWGVKYAIIWQNDVDIVVTESLGFHQIVNVENNINIARGLIYHVSKSYSI